MTDKEIKQIGEEKIADAGASENNNIVNNKDRNEKSIEPSVLENKELTDKRISAKRGAGKKRAEASDKTKTKIPQKKIKIVEELKRLAEIKKTIMIASIKNLPASQFQEICKKLRGKAVVKVPKKNIILRAIDFSDGEEINKLKEKVDKDIAILFSDLDAFELASELVNNKSSVKAKTGQEAPENIIIEEGPTDLVPGPAVSEFGALGIQIAIENGKISIKKEKVLVKKGEKISEGAAGLMNKLDIKPFMVGFEPLVAFDTQENKLYSEIKIDKEGTLNELKIAFGKALPFAVEIGYACEDTIKFLISKAGRNEKALGKLISEEKKENVEVKENVAENTSEAEPTINDKSTDERSDSEASEIKKPSVSEAEENKNTPQLNQGEENK